MGIKYDCANIVGSSASFVLKKVFHRPSGFFPGKIALKIDSDYLSHASKKMQAGSILVVGTNGKTTCTLLLADTLEAAGMHVICNRTGANMATGVAAALLQNPTADWGVFEMDELWLAKVAPFIHPTYVVLLNLFPDQTDRFGDISVIQSSITEALSQTPETTLIYNADDPNCEAIAREVSNPCIALGTSCKLSDTSQETKSKTAARDTTSAETCTHSEDAHTNEEVTTCPVCSSPLSYTTRQYSQLGNYACPACDFARPKLDIIIEYAALHINSLSFKLSICDNAFTAPVGAQYMVYNLSFVAATAHLLGVPRDVIQRTINTYNPSNGRLQTIKVAGMNCLINLAKNPAGMNENIRLVCTSDHPEIVAFFVNDAEGDGRDVSWLWDVDFEALAAIPNVHVFAGGTRADEVRTRLAYAGISAHIVNDATNVLAHACNFKAKNTSTLSGSKTEPTTNKDTDNQPRVFLIANYTALPPIREEMTILHSNPAPVFRIHQSIAAEESDTAARNNNNAMYTLTAQESMAEEGIGKAPASIDNNNLPVSDAPLASQGDEKANEAPFVIARIAPHLLGANADAHNARILQQRLAWQGVHAKLHDINSPSDSLAEARIVVFGGPTPRTHDAAISLLASLREELSAFVQNGGIVLATGEGAKLICSSWQDESGVHEGLGLIAGNVEQGPRTSGNAVCHCDSLSCDLRGFQNHTGIFKLTGEGETFVGTDENNPEGLRCGNVFATWLYGPVLAQSPDFADALIACMTAASAGAENLL